MPRNGRGRITDQTLYITVEDMHLVSTHLTNTYWKMCKELKTPLECPICMTDLINPPVDEVPSGYCLRVCGHSTCLRCYISQLKESEVGTVTCPVCRDYFLWA